MTDERVSDIRHSRVFAVEHARFMYRRMVQGWAHDALRLRSSGLDRPVCRIGGAGSVRPAGRVGVRSAGNAAA